MAAKVDFYQIVYREEQKSACYPFARVYFNEKLTPFFENTVIERLVLASEAEKISVCSWKLKDKMRWNVRRPRTLTEEILQGDYEVMSFTGNTQYHQFLYAAEKWHPGIRGILGRIMGYIGKSMPGEIKNPIYQNHFSARQDIYKKYVREYLSPAMAFMEADPDCWKDSGYTQLNKTDAASADWLQRTIGIPYYPMHPFVCERLFAIFCHNERIKVDYL